MTLDDSIISKEPNGELNEEYCKWCYNEGGFTYHNIDELIDFCVEHMYIENYTKEQVRNIWKICYSNLIIGRFLKNKSINYSSKIFWL